jgi:hypothetical protein
MMVIEHRKERRVEFQAPVEVYPVFPQELGTSGEQPSGFLKGRLLNLSENGMGMATDHELRPGAVVQLRFALFSDRWLELFGKIAWSEPNRAGLGFFSHSGVPQKSLRLFLRQRQCGA